MEEEEIILLAQEQKRAVQPILASVERIEASMERVPEGILEPLNVSVTDKIVKVSSSTPWFKFTIKNDGPDPVYIMLNEITPRREAPLNIYDDLTVDYEAPKIVSIYLVCGTGKSASVRIYASR